MWNSKQVCGKITSVFRRRTGRLVLLGGVVAILMAGGTYHNFQPAAATGAEDSPVKPAAAGPATEAPAGNDNLTNGFIVKQTDFDKDRGGFEDVEKLEDGKVGPVYNATSCAACHQNPVTGAASQIVEIRAGRRVPDPNDPNPKKVVFQDAPGGSVIQQRAIKPEDQETVPPEDDVRTFRLSTNILGDGFIEALTDRQILDLRVNQRKHGMEGFPVVVLVPVYRFDKPGEKEYKFHFAERIGRFGWKSQHASLLGFSADAYLNEMGITSPLQKEELTSLGKVIKPYDPIKGPEDEDLEVEDPTKPNVKTPRPFGTDVEKFTRFMRSTKVPPVDATIDVSAGKALFLNKARLGCAICHHPEFTTPPAGTKIVGLHDKRGSDRETVSDAHGNKIIRPYSDFMLHDIGTGDGIAQSDHIGLRPLNYRPNADRVPEAVRIREGIGRVVGEPIEPEKGRASAHRVVPDLAITPTAPNLDQRTAFKMRTAPLWGLRSRPQLMHDGLSLTVEDAIRRHRGQADGVRLKFESLTDTEKKQLLDFLKSL